MKGNKMAGIVFIILGSVFLLRTLGIINFEVWPLLLTYWPVLLILIGISMILRQGWMTWLLVALTAVVGASLIVDQVPQQESTTHSQTVFRNGAERADVSLHYGAGELRIKEGTDEILENTAITADSKRPNIKREEADGVVKVEVQRGDVTFAFGKPVHDSWDVRLSRDIVYDRLYLAYGAADVNADLRDLKIDKLVVEGGAADSTITFPDYPVKAEISTGASSLKLRIPKDAGVKIEYSGGLASADFDGFEKDGNTYTLNSGDEIVINISAGMASIETELY